MRRLQNREYLIVETGLQTYVQTQRRGDAYVVEHRDGSPDRHVGTELSSADEVAQAMRRWLAGDASELARLPWTKVDL